MSFIKLDIIVFKNTSLVFYYDVTFLNIPLFSVHNGYKLHFKVNKVF